LQQLQKERALLDRTAALFARFPDSRFAPKVGREQLEPRRFPRTSRDPELEAALASDPELSAFLRHSSFYLPARRRAVAELVGTLSKKDYSEIRCPCCAVGILRIPEEFFERL
jgi:hypothetical protein